MTDTVPLTTHWARFLEDPSPAPDFPAGEIPGEAEGYHSVERLLHKMTNEFAHRWGGSAEEWLAKAQDAWLHAHRRYDPALVRTNPTNGKTGPVKYVTFVQHCVFRGMLNLVRRRYREQLKGPRSDVDPGTLADARHAFSLRGFLFDFSEDAQTALRVFFADAPDTLTPRQADRARDAWAETLRQELGWPAARVLAVWDEIRGAVG